jgi:hypothetical protein
MSALVQCIAFLSGLLLFVESLQPQVAARINGFCESALRKAFTLGFARALLLGIAFASFALTMIAFLVFLALTILDSVADIDLVDGFTEVVAWPMIFPGISWIFCRVVDLMASVGHGWWIWGLSIAAHAFMTTAKEHQVAGTLIFAVCVYFGLPIQSLNFSIIIMGLSLAISLLLLLLPIFVVVYLLTLPAALGLFVKRTFAVRTICSAIAFVLMIAAFVLGQAQLNFGAASALASGISDMIVEAPRPSLDRCIEERLNKIILKPRAADGGILP